MIRYCVVCSLTIRPKVLQTTHNTTDTGVTSLCDVGDVR